MCHWCSSSCCPDAESQSGWIYMSLKCIEGPLRGRSFFCHPTLPRYYSQNLWGLTFLALGLWDEWSGLGLGSVALRYLSCFLPTTCGCGITHSCLHASWCLSAPLHVSATPSHLDVRGFFKSLVVRLPQCSIL